MSYDRRTVPMSYWPIFEEIADLGEKELFLPGLIWLWRFLGFFFPEGGEQLDKQEYGEADDQKIDNRLDKGTVHEGGYGVTGSGRGDHIFQIGKIDPPQEKPQQRHQQIVDQRGYDLAESPPDDHCHSQIDHIALHRELLEFFEHPHTPSQG